MFRIANHLLGRKRGSILPHDPGGPTAVANRFAHHCVDKLNLIRIQIQSRPTPAGGDNTHACIAPLLLLSVQPATLTDVMALINSGKTMSSKIDPLPSAHRRLSAVLRESDQHVIHVLHCHGPSEARCRYASPETFRSCHGQLLQLSADLKSAVCVETTRPPRVSTTAFAYATQQLRGSFSKRLPAIAQRRNSDRLYTG